jgi:serine/threonine-protein phosphatase Stp1
MKTLRFRATHETHAGLRRRENEDSVAIHTSGMLWAVADGMGGHLHGRFASDSVVRSLTSLSLRSNPDNDVELIQRSIQAANRAIYSRSQIENATIGTTLVALYCNGTKASCLWVGDSRIYRYREGVLEQLTRDHTQVRHLLDTKQITLDEAKTHPMSHVLTRAVGVDPVVKIESRQFDIQPEDIFLLCSDGLTACAEADDIAKILREAGATRACAQLLDLCLERGAPDNVSIIVITCDEVTALEEEQVTV